jgi:hypothetical protein
MEELELLIQACDDAKNFVSSKKMNSAMMMTMLSAVAGKDKDEIGGGIDKILDSKDLQEKERIRRLDVIKSKLILIKNDALTI